MTVDDHFDRRLESATVLLAEVSHPSFPEARRPLLLLLRMKCEVIRIFSIGNYLCEPLKVISSLPAIIDLDKRPSQSSL